MALDALRSLMPDPADANNDGHDARDVRDWRGAIEALRAQLEQGEQEPVAWMCPDDPEQETAFSWQSGHCVDCGKKKVPVYTAPPKREWQGLTDEDIEAAFMANTCCDDLVVFEHVARAIEAKLKEKNT